jgi:twitching motility protein PilT
LYRPRGLVLVTGPTGSGKSTTLASMLNIINEERACHIITVEDPIEFYHQHKRSMVIQREIGVDVPSFEDALKRALRQDPDVILVGEMRDLETMEAAVSAAETGHLVFATLHTTGAARTVDRIVDAFPTNQQSQIRTQLASSLLAVISQVLLPREDKPGRVRNHGFNTVNPGFDPRQQDIPYHLGIADRSKIWHEYFGYTFARSLYEQYNKLYRVNNKSTGSGRHH